MTIQLTAVFTTNDLPRIMADLDRKTHDLARAGIEKAFETADAAVPVDTSKLKDSGHIVDAYQSDKSVALVYDATNTSGDPYGRYVEFGTRFMKAQPFIQPALYDAAAEIINRAPEILGG